ncbi:MAG: hypothetical protein ACUVS7_19380 [Bryobacteraceae bacterium]
MSQKKNRRGFLGLVTSAGFGGLVASTAESWGLQAIQNPLASYPHRDWERAYPLFLTQG